ncbi:putative reverse transcriptase domain-containing protein [Tanacetum coccineum]
MMMTTATRLPRRYSRLLNPKPNAPCWWWRGGGDEGGAAAVKMVVEMAVGGSVVIVERMASKIYDLMHAIGINPRGDTHIWSTTGMQQGDPLRPLLFALILHQLLHKIKDGCKLLLHAWYHDDGTLIGDSEEVDRVLDIIKVSGPGLGLEINIKKTEIFWPSCNGMKLHEGLFPIDIRRPSSGVKLLGRAVSRDADFISELNMRRAMNDVDLMSLLPQLHDPQTSRAQSWVLQDHILRNSGICGRDDDYVSALACLCDTIPRFDFSGFTNKDNTKAVFECLRAPHSQDFLLAIPIDGLGQHMHVLIPLGNMLLGFDNQLTNYHYEYAADMDIVWCRRAGISANKEGPVNFLTDASDGRSTLRPAANALVFGWVGGKHACADLTGVSSLVGLSSMGFLAGQTALKASSCKVTKHEKACILKINMCLFLLRLIPLVIRAPRRELQCIGATTLGEYSEYFEKNPSFECCFKQVYVNQPTEEDTVTILRGLRERYELHHGVRISDSALVEAAILSHRIKAALSHIVDENQSAFVPGRAITDNILLTQEMLKGYNCANGPKRCSFKIDIQKAYDTVSWNFIEDVLKYFRFPDKMLLKITPHYLVSSDDLIILSDEAKSEICSIFPFKEAVRYLGVPLITKKIGVNDCKQQLVDKVKKKLNDWKNKNLSYAGRAQLIASVLGSMQVYWGSVFLLPKIVIKDIESCFKKFLWNSGDSCKGKAKIAWLDVCKPKDQGGLGFKSLDLWNIASRKESLWWIGDHIRHKIGDGKSISVWHDKWYNGISLSSLISKKEVFYAGFKDRDSIQDVLNENGWKWPQNWVIKFPWLANIQIPNFTNPDKTVWIDNNGNEKNFSTNTVWKDVRGNDAKVCWKNVVWHPNCIPKHTFILWLAAKGRLCTQDKLMKWYPNKSYECSLCKKMPDSHDHLFFGCEYAQKFWKMICEIANLKIKADKWDKILEELSNDNDNKSICGVIRKLCLAAGVYLIWQERNLRLAKLVSIKVKNSKNVLQAEAKWNVKFTRWKADADTNGHGWVCFLLGSVLDLYTGGCTIRKDAIFVKDEAAAKLKKEITSKPTALDEIKRSLLQLEMERLSLTSITDKALKDRLNLLEAELARLKKKQIHKLKQSEMAKLLHLEEELHKGVVGQNTTVTAVAEAFQRSTAGLSDPHHPIFTKLEFSNGTAEILKTNEQNNPRFDGFTMGYIETDLLNIIAYS